MSDSNLEEKLLSTLQKNLDGLHKKIKADFSEENFRHELDNLHNDKVYSSFSFDLPEYVLIRLIGRVSISIGRRLGEIYDKLPRIVAMERYNISAKQVAPLLDKRELDIALNFSQLSFDDVNYIKSVIQKYFPDFNIDKGIGIEIRYNFNPNDSSRLRKDEQMAYSVRKEGFLPIYLVFSSISPRDDAIARLKRAGWEFLIGEDANSFINNLLNFDIIEILNRVEIKKELNRKVDDIMRSIIGSFAFQEVIKKYQVP